MTLLDPMAYLREKIIALCAVIIPVAMPLAIMLGPDIVIQSMMEGVDLMDIRNLRTYTYFERCITVGPLLLLNEIAGTTSYLSLDEDGNPKPTA